MDSLSLPHIRLDHLEINENKRIYVVLLFARICRCSIATSIDMIRSVMLRADAAEHKWEDAHIVDVPCHELALSTHDTLLLMQLLAQRKAHAVFQTYFELYGKNIERAMKLKTA